MQKLVVFAAMSKRRNHPADFMENIITSDCEPLLCRWCNKSLKLNNSFEKDVCSNCYRKLTAAGLKDEEIFKSENFTSNIDITSEQRDGVLPHKLPPDTED